MCEHVCGCVRGCVWVCVCGSVRLFGIQMNSSNTQKPQMCLGPVILLGVRMVAHSAKLAVISQEVGHEDHLTG